MGAHAPLPRYGPFVRHFNTAGPCNPLYHYMLAPERRIPEVRGIIEEQGYYVVHAARQSGKTTAVLALAQQLTAEGTYAAALLSVEVGQTFSDDPDRLEPAILQAWRESASAWLPRELQPPPWPEAPSGSRLSAALAAWSEACPRPLVLFLDEVDALRDDGLISVLRQLRDGFPRRPGRFPFSVALVGLRDIRDYRVASGSEGRLGTSSPFNIKVESVTLRDFTRDDIAELYAQHTAEVGQVFTTEAVDRAFDLSFGQPWLVNALARQLVSVLVPHAARAITGADVDAAAELLIQRNDTHLDSLAERLREPRIRQIIEPMLAGLSLGDVPADDIGFALDLGLVRRSAEGGLVIANPIYREVIPRMLGVTPRASLPQISPSWLTPAGSLDERRLLDAFISFWRRHGEPLLKSAPYHEIAPHLVLLAFLERVANGGGRVEREYAIGRGRMDVCLRLGGSVLGIEIKVWRPGRKDPCEEGLSQLDGYLAGLGAASGWLVIFDRRPGLVAIEERVEWRDAMTPGGRKVVVFRG